MVVKQSQDMLVCLCNPADMVRIFTYHSLRLKADRPPTRNYPHTHADRRTDGRYQVHNLPRFAVDN